MAEKSKIQWTDSTLNFWEGCSKLSPGCANCYAETRDKHFHAGGHWGPGGVRRKSRSAVKDALRLNAKPWHCDECGIAMRAPHLHGGPDGFNCRGGLDRDKWHRRRIFSLSLGDWLEGPPITVINGVPYGGVPVEWRVELLDTIWKCSNVEFILCTKRIEDWLARMMEARDAAKMGVRPWIQDWLDGKAPHNVTLLTSVENQEEADKRIPALLRIPAARRGLSLEPLLGPVDLSKWFHWTHAKDEDGIKDSQCDTELGWLIVGGESGPKARPMQIEWVQSLADQATAAGVPLFIKQDSGRKSGMQGRIPDALWSRKEFPI